MKEKRIKVQITLPKELVDKIEEELQKTLLSKSAWFTKAALSELEKGQANKLNVIKLDI